MFESFFNILQNTVARSFNLIIFSYAYESNARKKLYVAIRTKMYAKLRSYYLHIIFNEKCYNEVRSSIAMTPLQYYC